MNVLILLLLSPLFGVGLVALLPKRYEHWMRVCALLSSLVTLLLSLTIYTYLTPNSAAIQLLTTQVWNAELGTSFSFGVDGFSYPLVVLTALLTSLALFASTSVRTYQRGYYSLILILESATLGVFMAQDWALFYVLWELVLIPLFFLIDRWGSQNRQNAALNFVLYTMGGSVFLLLALLVLFDSAPSHQFSFVAFKAAAATLDAQEQALLLGGFIIGFGVKLPLFPLHGWLPLAYGQAPMPVTLLLSGILSKMGAYGFIRVAELLPAGMQLLQPLIMTLGAIGVIYGGLLAWRQTHLKQMIAYSSFSHMGMVLIGIACLNQHGITGALVQMVAHALTASLLFLLAGLLKRHTQSYQLGQLGGLIITTPRLALLFIVALSAGIGLPASIGFVAEIHTLLGSLTHGWGWTLVLMGGMLLTAIYSLTSWQTVFLGPSHAHLQTTADLSGREFGILLAFSSLIWIGGIYPAALINFSATTLNHFAQLFAQGSL